MQYVHTVPGRVEFTGGNITANSVLWMGKKHLKKDQRTEYHRVFKTGKKSSGDRRKKTASRKVK